jgi:hypothetical protein
METIATHRVAALIGCARQAQSSGALVIDIRKLNAMSRLSGVCWGAERQPPRR